MKILLGFLGFVFISFGFNNSKTNDHALYLSVIQIKHYKDSPSEINIKVFTDDLQSALRNEFSDYKPVLETALCEERSQFLLPYFTKYFSIIINDLKEPLIFKNCQKEGEVYWLTFEINSPKNWENIKVEADFFMELFPTQSNVLNIEYEGEKRYGRMTKSEPFCETEF